MTNSVEKSIWNDLDPAVFTGTGGVRIDADTDVLSVGTVRFDPGCRNNWHTHPVSQILVVTEGLGFYQEEGKPAQVLRPGVTVEIGKDVNHWHGAARDTALIHIAITVKDSDGTLAQWGGPVDDATYDAAHEQLAADPAPALTVTAGRDRLGDLAPFFGELNDDVLFGKVWARSDQLSVHDRCVVTIVAMMSTGMIDSSLDFHLQNAKNNGVTKQEIAEIITHAAFYVGWPKAWGVFNKALEIWT